MKQRKTFVNSLYKFIGFALVMVMLNIFGFFQPIPDILAGFTLFYACIYIGLYSNPPKAK